jgi:hypothetical protein
MDRIIKSDPLTGTQVKMKQGAMAKLLSSRARHSTIF